MFQNQHSPHRSPAQLPQRSAGLLSTLALIFAAASGCGGGLSTEDMLERGKYLTDKNRSSEAVAQFDEIIRQDPQNAEAYYLRGLARERNDDIDGAIEDYGRAVAAQPDYVGAYNNRAVLVAGMGDFEKAIADFSSVLKYSPKFAVGYQNRGLAYHDVGEFEKALADFDRAIKLQPDSGGYFLRANLLLELGRNAEAVVAYDHSLEADDANARARLNRGIALSRLGKQREARADLRMASQLDSEIMSSDLLGTLESLARGSLLGPEVPIELVREAISGEGWKAERSDSETFPFTILKGDQTRRLCVATKDLSGNTLTLPADLQTQLLDDSQPKSLLVVTDDGQPADSWTFIQQWSPTEKDVQVASITISLTPSDSGDTAESNPSEEVIEAPAAPSAAASSN